MQRSPIYLANSLEWNDVFTIDDYIRPNQSPNITSLGQVTNADARVTSITEPVNI